MDLTEQDIVSYIVPQVNITSTNEEVLSSVRTISRPTSMCHGFSPYVINERDFLWTYGTNEAFRIVMLK